MIVCSISKDATICSTSGTDAICGATGHAKPVGDSENIASPNAMAAR